MPERCSLYGCSSRMQQDVEIRRELLDGRRRGNGRRILETERDRGESTRAHARCADRSTTTRLASAAVFECDHLVIQRGDGHLADDIVSLRLIGEVDDSALLL